MHYNQFSPQEFICQRSTHCIRQVPTPLGPDWTEAWPESALEAADSRGAAGFWKGEQSVEPKPRC